MTGSNQLRLSGFLRERATLRYTPAGIPMLNLVIEHQSEQQEAGQSVKVQCRLTAIAAGKMTERLMQWPETQPCIVSGFLAQAGRYRNEVMLHITAIE